MEIIEKKQFFEITTAFEVVPHTQAEGWCEMFTSEDESRIVFFVDDKEVPMIACMAHIKQFLGKKLLLIEGECLKNKNITASQIKDFYNEIRKSSFDFIEISSSLPYSADYEIGIRQAGYLRPAGLFSTSLSILVNLSQEIEYDKNWRKNLRRTEKNALLFNPILLPSQKDFEDYIAIHQAMSKRKQFVDYLTLTQLLKLFSENGFYLFFVEDNLGVRIAGMILYVHKGIATLVYSATSKKGREYSASYLLYAKIFTFLKEEKGVLLVDMGRISPAAHKKNDIFLFKNGVRGTYIQYNGEWSWYKYSFYRPLMYFVKKHLFKRIEV